MTHRTQESATLIITVYHKGCKPGWAKGNALGEVWQAPAREASMASGMCHPPITELSDQQPGSAPGPRGPQFFIDDPSFHLLSFPFNPKHVIHFAVWVFWQWALLSQFLKTLFIGYRILSCQIFLFFQTLKMLPALQNN